MTGWLNGRALSLLRVWKPGSEPEWAGSAFISVTDFRIARWRDLPSAWLEGVRLRRTWPGREGAVGLWLWALPWARCSGSVSVWRSEDDLRRFVGSARHRQTMQRFRPAGEVTSAGWTVTRFEPDRTWSQAASWLAEMASKRRPLRHPAAERRLQRSAHAVRGDHAAEHSLAIHGHHRAEPPE